MRVMSKLTARELAIAHLYLPPTWQEEERQAVPWQARQGKGPLDPAYAPEIVVQNGAPPSDKEYARRAAEWRAKNPPTKFYDGFER